MQKYADVVQDRQGNVVPGAEVRVKTSAGVDAVLYADAVGTPANNPIITDNFGRFAFYVANGRYNLQVYLGTALLTTATDILLEDPMDETPEAIKGGIIKDSALLNVTIDGKAPAYKEDTDALDERVTNIEEASGASGRWCGAFPVAPTTRLNGDPLQEGDEYQNTVTNLRYTWSGGSWFALNSITKNFEFTYLASQAQYDVGVISGDASITTAGMVLWVEGVIEYDFTVDDAYKFTLGAGMIAALADGAQMRLIVNANFDDVVGNLAELDAALTAAEAQREEEFQQFLADSGMEVPIPYMPGLVLTRRTQVVIYMGDEYRVNPNYLPLTTSTWSTDAPFMVLSEINASLVKLEGRPISDSLEEMVNIRDGRYGAIGDGTYHPLSERYADLTTAKVKYPFATSLAQSIDWAATQKALYFAAAAGRRVWAPAGSYVMTDTVYQPPLVRVRGDGQMDSPSTPQDLTRPFTLAGTVFLFYGTGARTHVANLAACDGTTEGDVHTNTSTFEPGYDSVYRKTSFWNHDANPTTGAPATQRQFSCAWKVQQGGFSQLCDLSIIPYYNGVAGYATTAPNWADDWDIGVWIDNHHDLFMQNASVVGYWRMAGVFGKTSLPGNDLSIPDFERNKFSHCVFQGFASFLLRGSDLYDIKAVGPDWIEIEWFDSHPFDPAFDNTFRTQEYAGLFCSYTGTTKVGANLRITGVSPSPAAIDVNNSANRVILGRRTNGVADANWDNCYFYGMNHRLYRATSAALGANRYTTPARCIEVSGGNIRGLKFNDSCKVMSADDIALYLGNVLQFEYNGSFESKNVEGRGSGIRNVCGPNSYQIRFGQRVRGSGGCDMRPAYPTTDGRFTTPGDLGMFSPNQVLWDGWSYGINGHVDIRPGAGQRVGFTDDLGVPTLYRTALGDYGYLDGAGVRIVRYENDTDTWTTTGGQQIFNNRAGVMRAWLTANDANLYGEVTRLYNAAGTVVMFRLDSTTSTLDVAGRIRPDTDGTRNLGDSAKRWSVVYASTGTINTSDARKKTPVRPFTANEMAAARALREEPGFYQFLADIERKQGTGEDARLHCGMTVQRAIEVMESFDLNPFDYGFICYDQWGDEWEDVPAVLGVDEEGETIEVTPATTRLVVPAGDLFSFRPDELLFFCMRASAQAEQQMMASIEALSQRLALLEN